MTTDARRGPMAKSQDTLVTFTTVKYVFSHFLKFAVLETFDMSFEKQNV